MEEGRREVVEESEKHGVAIIVVPVWRVRVSNGRLGFWAG